MIDPMPFATYSFVMSITPGPNNVMLTASGATFGFRKTIPHILGVLGGFSLVLFLVCAGLDAVFTRWPAIQTVLRWVGAAYLVYLGWRILLSGEAKSVESRKRFYSRAIPEKWLVMFTHDHEIPWGYLEKDERGKIGLSSESKEI